MLDIFEYVVDDVGVLVELVCVVMFDVMLLLLVLFDLNVWIVFDDFVGYYCCYELV